MQIVKPTSLLLVKYFILKYNGMQTKVSTYCPKLSESSQTSKMKMSFVRTLRMKRYCNILFSAVCTQQNHA